MGRTLPSITSVYYSELAALSAFKHALKRSDQLVFDELFVFAHKHLAEAAYAAHPNNTIAKIDLNIKQLSVYPN